jgi:small subunit ribosomal protein S1
VKNILPYGAQIRIGESNRRWVMANSSVFTLLIFMVGKSLLYRKDSCKWYFYISWSLKLICWVPFSGLLHASNITRAEITSISDILFVDEKVKVLVVKSAMPDKISLR